MEMIIIIPVITFIAGGLLVWLGMRFIFSSNYKSLLQEAEKEAEVIKKNKLLEVKEKFLHLKADLEKQVSQRNAKIQSVEAKLKQKELTINQRQEELQRKNNELDAVKENLSTQLELVDRKKQELDKMHQRQVEQLETISGLSADDAKERLIESLKDEAKTQAASYINEIVEESKMTANKEAKKIVIQSIQRVATETAIENSITVFHIDRMKSKDVSSVVKVGIFGL
jgi:ribonuclease Y